jgi:serine protease AprX
VDAVAPGASVLGLRVPGGTADSENPQARVGDRFARASGTSQAAAVVSGEAALILQQSPWMTPDQVKHAVMGTAQGIATTVPIFGGSGLVDLRGILQNPLGAVLSTVTGLLNGLVQYGWGSGTGSLEASRGTYHVIDGTTELKGEADILGRPWTGSTWARQAANRSVWSYGAWRGALMSGPGWQGGAWPTTAWAGTDWSGLTWSSDAWTASSWHASSWHASSWHGVGWF